MSAVIISPGDNLVVLACDGRKLVARPDRRGHAQPWFWWSFAMDDPPADIEVVFDPEPGCPVCVGPLGPAVSLDDGASWSWLGAADSERSFSWHRPDGCRRVRFAMAPPYRLPEWRAFAASRPWLREETLCLSRRGRAVPLVSCGDVAAPAAIAVSARHHACESSASWVLEGLLDGWRASASLQQRVLLLAVPLMDLDGVEDGDAGKARAPHDHNRDYSAAPIYPETAAWMRTLPARAGSRLRLGLDLHAPWIRYHWNEHVYGVGSAIPAMAAEQRRLLDVWQRLHDGELPIGPNRLLPHGVAWNTAPNDAPACSRWYARLGACGLTVETPFHGLRRDGLSDLDDPAALVVCTPDRQRHLGRSLALAISTWLD